MTFIGTKDGTPIHNNEAPIPYGEMPWEWVGPVSQGFLNSVDLMVEQTTRD